MSVARFFSLCAAAALFATATPAAAKTTSKDFVTCQDGTTSKGGRGACARHGGIAAAVPDKTATDADKTPAATNDARTKADKYSCKDGTGAKTRLGCVGHGGLASNQPGANPPRTRDATRGGGGDEPGGVTMNPTGATAKCKDGTFSHAQHHTGACSRHGGVAEWLDGSTRK